jgi:hypothetical protein
MARKMGNFNDEVAQGRRDKEISRMTLWRALNPDTTTHPHPTTPPFGKAGHDGKIMGMMMFLKRCARVGILSTTQITTLSQVWRHDAC